MNGGDHANRPISSNLELSEDQLEELKETFNAIDTSGDQFIQLSELKDALHAVGVKIPDYEIRSLVEKYYSSKNSLSFSEFQELYKSLRLKDPSLSFKKVVHTAENITTVKSFAGEDQIMHSIRMEEQIAFSDWINTNLHGDPDLAINLPIDEDGANLYQKCADGLIICKLINLAVPETIDERALNKGLQLNIFTRRENLTLATNSARAIGCKVTNIDADDLAKGKPHLVLGLLWQIIRIGLFNQIDLNHVPGLVNLLLPGETLKDLQKLSPEQILIRWVNYHLDKAGCDRRLNNFTTDVMDSEIYTYLMKQVAPADKGVSLGPLRLPNSDKVARAEAMLNEAEKLECRSFVTSSDVANGVYKLNLAFTANLFNTWPGLDPPDMNEDLEVNVEDIVEETREEKTYRNWMNSMGVDPYVNHLYSDLSNGIIIFQLYDVIKKGIVEWKKVHTKFRKMSAMMDQIENCNYAILLGKQIRFSLIGMQGSDIYEGNPTLTLGLVWQLMRAYTLTVLQSCTNTGTLAADTEIVKWANEKLKSNGKPGELKSFGDSSLSNSRLIIDLIDAIKPGSISYDLVQPGKTAEEKHANAKYAVTSARKVGAKVYALPEDIVEGNRKMVMTLFACLMARDYDYRPNVQTELNQQQQQLESNVANGNGEQFDDLGQSLGHTEIEAASEPVMPLHADD